MCGFECAWNQRADEHPPIDALHEPAYALMKLALVATTMELA
jgi:hypothetical protein